MAKRDSQGVWEVVAVAVSPMVPAMLSPKQHRSGLHPGFDSMTWTPLAGMERQEKLDTSTAGTHHPPHPQQGPGCCCSEGTEESPLSQTRVTPWRTSVTPLENLSVPPDNEG